MVCNDCRYKSDCQLYGDRTYNHKDTCVYKDINEINSSTESLSRLFNEVKNDDPEFYDELKEIFNT